MRDPHPAGAPPAGDNALPDTAARRPQAPFVLPPAVPTPSPQCTKGTPGAPRNAPGGSQQPPRAGGEGVPACGTRWLVSSGLLCARGSNVRCGLGAPGVLVVIFF